MIGKSVLIIAAIIIAIAIAIRLYDSGRDEQLTNLLGGGAEGGNSNMVQVVIKSDGGWSANIKDSQSESHIVEGSGDRTIPITCSSDGKYSLTVQKSGIGSGTLNVQVVASESHSLQRSTTTSSNGIISLTGSC
ncbi:MAG: hypothetical protein ACJ71K_02695 [Nitrososphaeraceae archaeon]